MTKERLDYEQQEPAFLKRLRGEVPRDENGHQPKNAAIRARKFTSLDDDGDQPAYVHGDTNEPVTAAEYEALKVQSKGKSAGQMAEQSEHQASPRHQDDTTNAQPRNSNGEPLIKQNSSVEAGFISRKRRHGVKIGAPEDETLVEPDTMKEKKTRPKKRRKAVALSFSNEDGIA